MNKVRAEPARLEHGDLQAAVAATAARRRASDRVGWGRVVLARDSTSIIREFQLVMALTRRVAIRAGVDDARVGWQRFERPVPSLGIILAEQSVRRL